MEKTVAGGTAQELDGLSCTIDGISYFNKYVFKHFYFY